MGATTTGQLKDHLREAVDRIWNEGDLSFIDEHFADDYVLHELSRSEDIHGPEEFKAYVRAYQTAFPDAEAELDDMIAEGETAAVRYTMRGTHEGQALGVEPTGKTVEVTGMAYLRFENGKRKEDWFYDDIFGLLLQLGAVDSPAV